MEGEGPMTPHHHFLLRRDDNKQQGLWLDAIHALTKTNGCSAWSMVLYNTHIHTPKPKATSQIVTRGMESFRSPKNGGSQTKVKITRIDILSL